MDGRCRGKETFHITAFYTLGVLFLQIWHLFKNQIDYLSGQQIRNNMKNGKGDEGLNRVYICEEPK